jgi:hypothetical protein
MIRCDRSAMNMPVASIPPKITRRRPSCCWPGPATRLISPEKTPIVAAYAPNPALNSYRYSLALSRFGSTPRLEGRRPSAARTLNS